MKTYCVHFFDYDKNGEILWGLFESDVLIDVANNRESLVTKMKILIDSRNKNEIKTQQKK